MNKKFRIALFASLLIICGLALGKNYYDNYELTRENEARQKALQLEIENQKKQEEEALEKEEVEKISLLQKYKEINPDTVAYLEIPGTDISYPVLQTDNNDYYLNYSFENEKDYRGAVFMDYLNQPDFSDQNTVIYGHNTNKPGMFYDLSLFRQQEFTDEHNTFTVKLDDKILEFQIFSVYVTQPDYDYRTVNYIYQKDFQDFIDRIRERSLIKSNAEITGEDKILTLSTCVYDFDGARLAVHSVLKGEINESEN